MIKGSTQKEQNNMEGYILIDALKEYGKSYSGPRWLIATSLSEKVLLETYPDLFEKCSGYELIPFEIGEAIKESNREIEKLTKRDIRNNILSFNECTENTCFENIFGNSSFEYDSAVIMEQKRVIQAALDTLCAKQKARIIRHYIMGESIYHIASLENVTHEAVRVSLKAGIKNLKKYFEKHWKNDSFCPYK